jgi:hypothetical protein
MGWIVWSCIMQPKHTDLSENEAAKSQEIWFVFIQSQLQARKMPVVKLGVTEWQYRQIHGYSSFTSLTIHRVRYLKTHPNIVSSYHLFIPNILVFCAAPIITPDITLFKRWLQAVLLVSLIRLHIQETHQTSEYVTIIPVRNIAYWVQILILDFKMGDTWSPDFPLLSPQPWLREQRENTR